MKLFGKALSKVGAFLGSAHLVSGTVVATNHYPAPPPAPNVVVLGSGHSAEYVEVPTMTPSESWSVTVKGVDKRGNHVREEIYVPWYVWQSTKVGDRWPH